MRQNNLFCTDETDQLDPSQFMHIGGSARGY